MSKYLDDDWFDQLLQATAPVEETFTMLEPSIVEMDKKRREFEASNYQAIFPLFPDPNVANILKQPAEDLVALRLMIETDEPDSIVREVYLDYIDDLLANIAMIEAAAARDEVEYERLNRLLYGDPDREIFSSACAWIRSDVQAIISSASGVLAELGRSILDNIPVTDGNATSIIPSNEVFCAVRDVHYRPYGFFDCLFGVGGLPTKDYISQLEGDEICKRVLQNIGAGYRIVDAPANTWAVSREPRQLLRPVGYNLGLDEFIGLVGHEIGSHILESVNGAKKNLRLLEMGLAGYLKGNEGRALIREQIVYPDIKTAMRQPIAQDQPAWEFNIMKHLAVCLSLGYGGRQYNFAQLYEILYKLYYFWRERRRPGDPKNEAFAREQAWFLAVRIMKGTDGYGGCYRKDIVYLEGNVKLWQLAAENPEIILLGDQGKFNLLDPRHREIFNYLETA